MPLNLKTLTVRKKKKVLEAVKNRKRKRGPDFSDVEECVVKWFKQCRDANVSVGGPILKEKAENFAKSLGHEQFEPNNGWLENFKKRHDISFRKVCGESVGVSDNVVNEWKINLNETALFYKCMPDKTLTFKNEQCSGGKHSKEQLKLLLAVNMTGTDKLKPLIIGKSRNPRCFTGVKSFPVDYTANKKAWMTSELFAEWLLRINKPMKIQKPIKVKFLPPNTTSKSQPLDQRIIKTFKTLYREEIVRKIISDMDDEKSTVIDILHAMRIVDKTWRNVATLTIVNCFKRVDLYLNLGKTTH
ncbi:tigger transposable element-derived protein 4-like [Aphis gossypii]|uniref:tigger transposable element-derived protein 4-like n=1 Tax=Aphis gossypii TaxID=80765 RepID=UPI002158D918|nr:tigger transposable element-derived protein 4-like [Aphis gossypii]